jgi:hypothetical protein
MCSLYPPDSTAPPVPLASAAQLWPRRHQLAEPNGLGSRDKQPSGDHHSTKHRRTAAVDSPPRPIEATRPERGALPARRRYATIKSGHHPKWSERPFAHSKCYRSRLDPLRHTNTVVLADLGAPKTGFDHQNCARSHAIARTAEDYPSFQRASIRCSRE